MLSTNETRSVAKAFYEGIIAGKNVGHLAFLLNIKGNKALMAELFTVRGFKDLLAAALPPEQRSMGHLA